MFTSMWGVDELNNPGPYQKLASINYSVYRRPMRCVSSPRTLTVTDLSCFATRPDWAWESSRSIYISGSGLEGCAPFDSFCAPCLSFVSGSLNTSPRLAGYSISTMPHQLDPARSPFGLRDGFWRLKWQSIFRRYVWDGMFSLRR